MQQIEDYYQIHFKKCQQDQKLDALSKWMCQDKFPYSDFQLMEPVLAQRNAIFQTARITHKRKFIPQAMQSNTLFIIKEAVAAGYNNVAICNIAKMKCLEVLLPDLEAELLIVDSQMSWQLKDTNLAKKLLLRVMFKKEFKDLLLRSDAFRLYGEYLAENHSEGIDKIHDAYFMTARRCVEQFARDHNQLDMLKSSTASQPSNNKDDEHAIRMKKRLIINETIAKYMDREYIQVNHFHTFL